MTNSQLPADIQAQINMKAEHEAAFHFHPTYSPDQNTACQICYRNGAAEYAEWKVKHDELKIQRDKLLTTEQGMLRAAEVLQGKYDTAFTLLQKFISRHEAGLLPDRFIYDKIKTFLYGGK